MTLKRFLVVLVLLAVSLAVISASAAEDIPPAPRRIVSLNLCTDQLVLALADRDAVRSVTWLARDPQISMMAAEAAHLPVNYGLAEEIIPLAPDLVLAGAYTTRTTVTLLKRFGAPVVEVDVPQSVPAMYEHIRTVARLLGHPARGETMVAAMQAAQAALAPPREGPRPVAAVYRLNDVTVRRGSLIDDLLTRAGLRNLASELALTNYDQLPLDVLLLAQPDLLVLHAADDVTPSLAHQALHHPSLVKAFPRLHTLVVPPRLWSCAGPWVIDALALLHDAARRLAIAEVQR